MSGATELPAAPAGLDEVSAAWVAGLTCQGPEYDATVSRLHALLVRVALGEAGRRAGLNGIAGQELEDLAHHAASDAMVSILRRIADFRGASRFTTWAYKFVILEVSSKFARHAWRHETRRLDEEQWDALPARLGADPEDVVECSALAAAVREAVDEELTPHQRRVFVALVLQAMPLDVLAEQLGSSRNAIYKTMFDARRRLHRHLASGGYLDSGEGRGR